MYQTLRSCVATANIIKVVLRSYSLVKIFNKISQIIFDQIELHIHRINWENRKGERESRMCLTGLERNDEVENIKNVVEWKWSWRVSENDMTEKVYSCIVERWEGEEWLKRTASSEIVFCKSLKPRELGHSLPLVCYFRVFNSVDSIHEICRWLDSKLGPLVSEATYLPRLLV